MEKYLQLQNGTDVRGTAEDFIPDEPITLTEECVENIVKAFCVWLISHTGKTQVQIAVGYDSRTSSKRLCDAAVRGIITTGHNAVVTGLSTTPSMFMFLQDDSSCQGAIMITASHLPANKNGLKFFWPQGALNAPDVKEILMLAPKYRFSENVLGTVTERAYINDYAAALVEKVRKATGEQQPLLGKRILVDAGNGVGGFFVDKVLQPLGADTTGSQFLEPDGTFPNHIPNPENKEAMQSVCDAVVAANADFGIIFDTDVDRAGAVGRDGTEINRNRLIALISAILLEEKAGTIVTDSVTSDGLAIFIAEHGGRHHRFKRGYKNVINEAIRLNALGEYTPLAIETSGHAAFLENYFLDDGAYLIVRLLIALAKESKKGNTLENLIENLSLPAEALEIRVRFRAGCDFKTLGATLLKDFQAHANSLTFAQPAKDNYEGCRVCFDKKHGDGWALLRMSLHEPILPINVESNHIGGCLPILNCLYYFLNNYPFLNLVSLQNAIQLERKKLTERVKNLTKNSGSPF